MAERPRAADARRQPVPPGRSAAAPATPALPDRAESAFRAGVAHFDAGAYFEAHEVWEELWHAVRRQPGEELLARRLKALIQLAAALIKHREGRHRPAASLLGRACHLLGEGPDHVLGISGRGLAARARAHVEGGAPAPRIAPARNAETSGVPR